MSKIYIAKRLVGRFNSGDEVTGLTDARAEYLLGKGAIEVVEGSADADADADAVDLESLTVKQLKDIAEQKGIELEPSAKKADIITLLEAE